MLGVYFYNNRVCLPITQGLLQRISHLSSTQEKQKERHPLAIAEMSTWPFKHHFFWTKAHTSSILGLAPMKHPTKVVSIQEIFLSIIWSGILIENLPLSIAEISLTSGKANLPIGRTPNKLDHLKIYLAPPPESAKNLPSSTFPDLIGESPERSPST